MTKSFVLRHSGSQPMSSQTCNVGMPVFWRWGLVSVKSYPLLGVEPEEASQEALGEDAILHRSSGRPGEDKKKVEKMLGELPDAIDSFWMDDGCRVRFFNGASKTTISFKKVMFQVLFTMIMGGKVKDNASTKIQINYNKKKHTLQPGDETYPSTRCQHTLQFSSS